MSACVSAAWIRLEKTKINWQKTWNVANNHSGKQTNEQIKAEGRTHERPELLGDGAVAFQASCGREDGTATPTPYIMRPSASERGIPSNAVSRLESFIRFLGGCLEIHVRGIYGKWCLIEESDNNQSRWKKLPHGCSGGFGLWFQVWDEVMRHAVAQRSGSGGWNAYVQRRSAALAAQDKICPAHETKSVSHIWLCNAPNVMSFTRKRAEEISASICCRSWPGCGPFCPSSKTRGSVVGIHVGDWNHSHWVKLMTHVIGVPPL